MKLLALLFLCGCAVATSEWRWQVGKEYVYEYSGRLMTGLPDLASHYSGVGINSTVVLQVVESNRFKLYLERPKYVRINQPLQSRTSSIDGPDGENWREVLLPEMIEVDDQSRQILAQPIEFTFSPNGEIERARISRQEPEWSVNLKKALALLFQTKVDYSSSQNENRIDMSSPAEDEIFWKVKEESIDGLCENTYQINELPEYMMKDLPYLVPYPELCSGESKYYEVTKSKDIDTCEKRASFSFYKPGYTTCKSTSGGNCPDMFTRSSVTTYIACGTRGGNLHLQTIVNQGEYNVNMLGYNTERMVSGNIQKLYLKEVRPKSQKPSPSDMTELSSMLYEYSMTSHQAHQMHQELEQIKSEEGRIPKTLIDEPLHVAKAIPKTFLPTTSRQSEERIPKDQIKQQIKTLIKQLVTDMHLRDSQDVVEKQITSKILSVARGFTYLNKEDITEVYQQLKSELSSEEEKVHSMKNLYFDVVLMTGTQESIYFLKHMLQSNEMTKIEMLHFWMWLPQNLMVPSQQLLEQIFELVKCEPVRQMPVVEKFAIMSFSSLLNKACLADNRHSAYPTDVFGKFCKPNSRIVVEQWLPYLFQKLEQSESWQKKTEIIVALGQLPHKSIIGKLIPYVEGKIEGIPQMARVLTLWGIFRSSYKQPQVVEPVFYSIFANPAETTQMRINAFNALMALDPSMAVLHKISASTWIEQDYEVLKTINLALFTLKKEAEQETMSYSKEQENISLPRKAFLVYPLIKKTPGILPTSGSIYTSESLKTLGVGFRAITSWTSSNSSVIPSLMWTDMEYYLDKWGFKPWEMGILSEGTENIYNNLPQLLTPLRENESAEGQKEQLLRKVKDSLHAEYKKVMEKLHLKMKESGPMSGAFYFNFMETSPVFVNFQQLSNEVLREKISSVLRNPSLIKSKMCGEMPINLQRSVDMAPTVFLIPTDMGLPLTLENHLPVAISVRGSLNVDCNARLPSLTLRAKTLYTSQYTGSIGTVIPFTKEMVMTTIDEQSIVNIPAQLKLSLNIPEGRVQVSAKLQPEEQQSSSSNPTEFLRFHVHPFTFRKGVFDLTPVTKLSEEKLTPIRSEEQFKTDSMTFGSTLGLKLKSEIKTESRYTDYRSVFDKLAMYKYNPLNMFRFTWTSPALSEENRPSVRKHVYSLKYYPSESSTREIVMDLKVGIASKMVEGQPIKYHCIKVKTEDEMTRESQQETDPLKKYLKKILPYGIESMPIDEQSSHSNRREVLKEVFNEIKQDVKQYAGLVLSYTTVLRGSRPTTWNYQATLTGGKKDLPDQRKIFNKWNLVFKDRSTSGKVQVIGNAEIPILPIWNFEDLHSSLIDFRYHNSIQVNDNQWRVVVDGNAKVSEEQKQYSRLSPESRKCHRMIQENVPGARMSQPCEIAQIQARTVDEVAFNIKYVNVPEDYQHAERWVVERMRALLWPFYKVPLNQRSEVMSRPGASINESPVLVRLFFKQQTPSFDLVITRPQGKLTFEKIRIPYPVNLLFPLKAGINNAKFVAQKITGKSLYPSCKVDNLELFTFDNKSMPFRIDYCFHLLAADCHAETFNKFAVLIRNMRPGNRRELQVFLGKHLIMMTPSERPSTTSPFPSIRITIDQEEVTLQPYHEITLKSPIQPYHVLGKLFKSNDNIIRLIAPKYDLSLTFGGESVKIETSQLSKNKMCGICGNLNNQRRDELVGPKKCIHSKPEVMIASFRVNDMPSSCNSMMPLTPLIQEKLEHENEQCIKPKIFPTKITKSFKVQNGKCTILKHVVVRRPNQICLSKRPVTQCSPGCSASHEEILKKLVPFTCMQESRLAEHYARKAAEGKRLPELTERPTTFETKVPQPRSCMPSHHMEL